MSKGKARLSRTSIGFSILLLSVAAPASAEPSWECLEPALQQELENKLQFQDDFSALVAAERPDLAEIANLAASASKSGFEIRYSRIAWLWENHRARLSSPDSFWSYSWNEGDTKAWRLADENHAAAQDIDDSLKQRLREHQKANAFRSFASENRGKDPFLSLATAFSEQVRLYRDSVEECY